MEGEGHPVAVGDLAGSLASIYGVNPQRALEMAEAVSEQTAAAVNAFEQRTEQQVAIQQDYIMNEAAEHTIELLAQRDERERLLLAEIAEVPAAGAGSP